MGGPGLVLLGIADNSVVPLTGSMDVLTIWLAARHRQPWPYYALMATLGAVIGGYITYALARKGGKEAMERKLSKKRAAQGFQSICALGIRRGCDSRLAASAVSFVPFLVAAGAMQYSRDKFLGALALGRAVRYSIAAFLGLSLMAATSCVSSRATTNPQWPFLIGLAVIGAVMS